MRGEANSLLQRARSAIVHGQSLYFFFRPCSPPCPSPVVTMATGAVSAAAATTVAEQKRALRSRIRKELKALSFAQRCQEDLEIQKNILDSSWFKPSKSLCAYVSCESLREVDTSQILAEVLKDKDPSFHAQAKKKLFVPRIEDKNGHMRLFNISTIEDLVANSMDILEPSPIDANGNQREDVMLANDPVDIFLLPGVAFDREGRRLGRGGGYYDVFLKNYQELAKERNWKQPLLIALAHSVQIMEVNVIPVTPTDVPVDAIVSPIGTMPISPAALERM